MFVHMALMNALQGKIAFPCPETARGLVDQADINPKNFSMSLLSSMLLLPGECRI